MVKRFYVNNLFLLSVLLAQIPTDYPPVRTREVPEHMQDQVTWFMIAGGIVLLLLLVGYFMRLDKRIVKWFRR
jgi:hypothetical protein